MGPMMTVRRAVISHILISQLGSVCSRTVSNARDSENTAL